MRFILVRGLFVLVCSGNGFIACTDDIDDTLLTIENPDVSISTTADVNDIHRGQSVLLNIEAANVFPVDPYLTPPPEHTHDAVFFKIYLDDTDSQELTATAAVSFYVTIPIFTSLGPHEIICKTFSHDGEDTDSDTSLDINVTAAVSNTPPVIP